jgi:hypothetical protein
MSKKLITIIVLLLTLMTPAVTAYKADIKIPVDNNGHGHIDLDYNPWFNLTAHITGQIESPKTGNWTIIIKVNGAEDFNESGILADKKYPVDYPIKSGKSRVHVDANWSEKAETTLVVPVEGCVYVKFLGCLKVLP